MLRFIVFSAGFNSVNWVKRHMESIAEQGYPNITHLVVDDNSVDGTWEEMEKHKHDRAVLIRNTENNGWLANAVRYLAEHINNPEDVIAGVDLDDWVMDDGVFDYLSKIYRDKGAWVTYGSLIRDTGEIRDANEMGWPKEVRHNNTFRAYDKWRFWAMRTFKAFMWNALDKRRLLDPSGNGYARFTYDWAIGFPLLEMCPPKRLYHVTKRIYVYNVSNPINDKKCNRKSQYDLGMHFKRMVPITDHVMEGQRNMQRFVVFSCGRDCAEFAEKHIKSIRGQTYQNYYHVIVDDASKDDGTYKTLVAHHDPKRTKIIRNKKNHGWLHNAAKYLSSYVQSEEDVIVVVDLDDYLADDYVFERLNNAYNRKRCWMTYGTWAIPEDERIDKKYRTKWGVDKPKPRPREAGEVLKTRDFRSSAAFSHLKTFKAFLWNAIDKEKDFKGPDGKWAPCCYDRFIMYPMLEMTPTGKIYRVKDLVYMYNIANPLCHAWNEKWRKRQIEYEEFVKGKEHYSLLRRVDK